MNIFDVIVIGGGPAGLFTAALTAEAGMNTCLLEAGNRAGRKLLLTGQGKCNITNNASLQDFVECYGGKKHFVRKCLYSFSNTDLINYFSNLNLKLTSRDDGKVFPESESAGEVLRTLLNMCIKSDVSIKYNTKAVSVHHNSSRFKIESIGECRNLVIATGGFTFPGTGSDGSGWKLAEMLGHTIIKPRPSLTGVITADDNHRFIDCAGITVDCEMELYRDDSKEGTYSGRLLFTHKGLSGPVIIDNSRDLRADDELRLNLLGGIAYDQAVKMFIEFCASNGKSGIKSFFTQFALPARLITAVFTASDADIEPVEKAAGISASSRKKLLKSFTALPFTIQSLEGKNHAMCTTGGINTAEVKPASMESRIIPGLYFAGEVLDVDGDSGGFNLQFAFSSAAAAAASIKE